MKFTPLASSSRGNAYLIQSEGLAPLLIEAGIPIKQLRERLWSQHMRVSDIAACIVSHEHMDHAKAVRDLLRAGVDCYMSEGTARALEVDISHRVYSIMMDSKSPLILSEWSVRFFSLEHDAAEPAGFFISDGRETLLFIPDTAYVKNRFARVNILAVECNNIAEILSKNVLNGSVPESVVHRIRRNHMGLQTVINMLKANDLSKCREIHLLHLSDGNSDEARMIRAIQEATGIPTFASQQ